MEERVYRLLMAIPHGRVVTYGQIAACLGNPRLSRVVGNILHKNPDGDRYPCYKVVDRHGCLAAHYAFGGLEAQRARLEREGIAVEDGRVDLGRFGWCPPPDAF